MTKERISGFQLFMLCTVLYVAGAMSTLFKTLAEASMQDAWMTFIFGLLYAWLIVFLLYRLGRAYPGKNMFEICEIACGKWLGRIVNLIVLVYVLHLLVRDLRIFGDFIGTAVLQRTPTEFIYLAVMLVLIYFATGNMEEFTRSVNLLYPIFQINLLLLPILLLNEIDLTTLQPLLAHGPEVIAKGGLLGAGWSGDIFIIGAFLSYIGSTRQFYVSVKFGIVISTIVLTMLMLLNTAVLGPITVSRAMYPLYTMAEQINITDFLDRLDVLLIGFWIPAYLMKMIMLYFCIMTGLSSMLGSGNLRGINVMSGWLALLLTLVSFKSVMEAYHFGNYASFPFGLIVHVVFFVCVTIGMLRGRAKRGRRESSNESLRINWGMWVFIVIALAAIVAGGYTGQWYKAYGLAGSAIYAAALIGVVVASGREFIRWNRIVRQPASDR